MKKIVISKVINAPKETVWHTMLDDESYRKWTLPFSPGPETYYKGNWEKGSKILFVGTDPDTGKEGGMVSRIAENKPYEYISIEHIGIMSEGVEDTTSPEARKWTPAFENYTFIEKDGVTEVSVQVDVADELFDAFEAAWPEALDRLKEIAEQQ